MADQAAMLALALALDAALGEPAVLWRHLPHPVVSFGRLIAGLDQRLNRGAGRRLKGVLAMAILVAAVGAPALLLALSPLGAVAEVGLGAVMLAQRSLVDHVRAVAAGLARSIEEGRGAVAMIVGRDISALDEAGVSRAAIESAAEGFCDGVVAPAFWFLVAGLPGIAIYKAVNTADSMIGHRTPRHEAFGWAAARLDDAMNWVPARLAGLLIALAGTGRMAIDLMRREARLHRSPNAGWPEAAAAASLGVALSGPRAYHGAVVAEPWINRAGRAPTRRDVDAVVRLVWRAWGGLLAIAAVLWLAGLGLAA